MNIKISEKSIPARWIQASAITFVLYLMMAISQSQSASSEMLEWRSSSTQAESVRVVVEIPPLPLLFQ